MRWFIVLAIGLSLGSIGCGRDYKKMADRMVRERLFANFEKSEAIPFLENQGRFFDVDETTTIDRDVVLPLLKSLSEVAPTRQWVMFQPEAREKALAILVELPPKTAVVDQMAEVVEAADAQFSGMILQQWGHDWLQLALVDEQTAERLKKNDPNIEKQR